MRKATALLLLVLSASAMKVTKHSQAFLATADEAFSADLNLLQQTGTCPAPATEIDQGGYKFCYLQEPRQNFEGARDWCLSNGLNLVEPRSQEYYDIVQEVCNLDPANRHYCTYLGAVCDGSNSSQDCKDPSNWRWMTDDAPVTFHDFRMNDADQITDGFGNPAAAELWVLEDLSSYWQASAQSPGYVSQTMCAMGDHTAPPPPADATCNGGTEQQVGGYKFCVADAGKIYDEAVQFCTANNSHLVAPHDVTLDHAINDICSNDPYCWINLKCDASDDSCDTSYQGWTWQDDQSALTSELHILFQADDDGTIRGGARGKTCASTASSDDCGDHWVPRDCADSALKTVCVMEEPEPLLCDGGDIIEHGQWQFCYSSAKQTMQAAEDFCESNNLTLVEPMQLNYARVVN